MKKKKATSKSSPNQQSHHNSRHAQRARILAELTEAGGARVYDNSNERNN